MARKKKTTAIPATLSRLRDVQVDIPTVDFTDAAVFRAAYDTADEAVKQAAEASVDKQADVIAALARMRSILSERGENRKIREEAGIKLSWKQYFVWFQSTYEFDICLRTVINKINRLSGKKFCAECQKANGHTPSCSKYKGPKPLSNLEARLIGSVSAAHELVRAIQNSGDVDGAVRQFEKDSPPPEVLYEWMERSRAPFDLQPADVVVVDGQKLTILEICGVCEEDNATLLTISVKPIARPNRNRKAAANLNGVPSTFESSPAPQTAKASEGAAA